MFVWAGAQTPDLSKLHPKSAKKASQQAKQKQDSKKGEEVAVVPQDYLFLRGAIQNTFMVVKQSYNVRKNGTNVSGNDFFGHRYTVLPIVEYGYVTDYGFQNPWEMDGKYKSYANCEECIVSVDMTQYRRLFDNKFRPFTMNSTPSDSLAGGINMVFDDFCQQKGMHISIGKGQCNGYMVWFLKDDKNNVDFTMQPLQVTLNENVIFRLAQPANVDQVIGGAFVSVNLDEPGTIRLNLMGIARLDPYGSGNWELVKFLREPSIP